MGNIYNFTLENLNNMSEICELGDCSLLNISTCSMMFVMEEESPNLTDELFDKDGCFYTWQLRETEEYQIYLKVNIWYRSYNHHHHNCSAWPKS